MFEEGRVADASSCPPGDSREEDVRCAGAWRLSPRFQHLNPVEVGSPKLFG